MNDHSKDSQTRYLREAAIVLAKEGFQLDEVHTDRLCIVHNRSAILCGSQQRLPELHWTVSAFFYQSKEAYP